MIKRSLLRRILTATALLTVSSTGFAADKLSIGITLQPYYSYVKAVVGEKA
ncbi:ABC transporter substrate-binding protein, partial [Vibrio parahaemolyticus]|nr:ABC transporter substrate-binding protein [Vibrio parahaemolyticus]